MTTTSNNSSIVQFQPFQSQTQQEFWHSLSNFKLNVSKLNDNAIEIYGGYTPGKQSIDTLTNKKIDLGCWFIVDNLNLPPTNTVPVKGLLKNFNTIEDFKKFDKQSLFDVVLNDIKLTDNVNYLNQFLLFTYADIKKFKFYYLYAYPTIISRHIQWYSNLKPVNNNDFLVCIRNLKPKDCWCYIIKNVDGKFISSNVESWMEFYKDVNDNDKILAFVDPSSSDHPGWVLRNVLYYINVKFNVNSLNVVAIRDSHSLYGQVYKDTHTKYDDIQGVGWEKNLQGKIAPKVVDLAPIMDPKRLADQAVDLNLKLMKWRILPDLNLDSISNTSCLLLGSGTLGCYVARSLMGWGVKNITFVDNGRVSYSNPVRQPLFEFEDCLDGGKCKATCAADRLKRVYPGVNANGHSISIPMPGHPIASGSEKNVECDLQKLEKLIDDHDAIFLLMDSRESRWLPTLLGAVKKKIVLNVALGFDSYLVMRHGSEVNNLGCYYCNDIVAPTDSLSDRTLDQMCTVTRPGLAPMAASIVVELLSSILQHPQGFNAPASRNNEDEESVSSSVLGIIPHQIRGFISKFQTLQIVGQSYNCCTGCSKKVIDEYHKSGYEMLYKIFNDSNYLTNLSGLDKLYQQSEEILADIQDISISDDDEF